MEDFVRVAGGIDVAESVGGKDVAESAGNKDVDQGCELYWIKRGEKNYVEFKRYENLKGFKIINKSLNIDFVLLSSPK